MNKLAYLIGRVRAIKLAQQINPVMQGNRIGSWILGKAPYPKLPSAVDMGKSIGKKLLGSKPALEAKTAPNVGPYQPK